MMRMKTKKIKNKIKKTIKNTKLPERIGIFSFTPLSSKSNFIQIEMMQNMIKKGLKLVYLGFQKKNYIDNVLSQNNLDIESCSFYFPNNNVKEFMKFVKDKLINLNLSKVKIIHGPWFQKTPKRLDDDIYKTIKLNQFNNFVSGEEIRKDFFIMNVNKIYPIDYYCVDPLEIDFTKSKYFNPDNIKKFCFYEYPDNDKKNKFYYSDLYINLDRNITIPDKKYDFYFSGNLKQRPYLLKDLCKECSFFKNIVDKNKIKIIIHLSDEYGNRKIYDNIFKKIPLVYRQYRFEKYNNNSKNIKYLPLGYHCWDKNYIKTNVKPIENRKYIWCFMGSPKNNRAQDFKILKENIKPYFNERTKAGENTKIFNDSIFTICPMGNVNIECSRQYAALLNGSIPILIAPRNKFKEIYNYFDIPPPFINVENIHECIDKIKSLLKDKNHLQNLQNKHLEWHRNIKEKISSNVSQILRK